MSAIRHTKSDLGNILHGHHCCGQLRGNWNDVIQRIAGADGHYSVWNYFILADLSTHILPSRNLLQGTKSLEINHIQHPINELDLYEDQHIYFTGPTP